MNDLSSFIERFSAITENESPVQGTLGNFVEKFSGMSDSFFFYNGTVEIRFDEVKHKYYLVDPELGNLIPIFNVSTVSKIVDRSFALIPWAAKATVEKLLAIIPTMVMDEEVWIRPISLADFTKLCMEAKSAHKDKLEDAGDVGKQAHSFIESYIKALMADDHVTIQGLMTQMCKDPRATNAVLAALAWMKIHNVRWKKTESKVYSKKYKCSGTMDGLALVDSCDDPLCCQVPFKDRLSVIDWKTSNYLFVEFLFQTAAYQSFYEEEYGDKIVDRWVLRLGKETGDFDPWHLTKEDFAEDFAGFVACLRLKELSDMVEGRMHTQKAHLREERKRIKELQKAEEKASKAVAKAATKAAKKIEKEALKAADKAAAKAERERLKAEIKAEKQRAEESTTTSAETGSNCTQPKEPHAVEEKEAKNTVPCSEQAEESACGVQFATEESEPVVQINIPQEG